MDRLRKTLTIFIACTMALTINEHTIHNKHIQCHIVYTSVSQLYIASVKKMTMLFLDNYIAYNYK